MSMNPHPSKGYISKFQIVFKHYSVTGLCVVLTSTENHKKSIFFNVNSAFKGLSMTVKLSNRLFLPFSTGLAINRDHRAVTGVICDAHFAKND